MRIENKDNILNFYESIKDEYPLSLEQVEEICRANWLYTKRIIESGSMEPIRQKYFGLIRVNKTRAKYKLKQTEQYFKENKITKEKFETHSTNLKNFINEN